MHEYGAHYGRADVATRRNEWPLANDQPPVPEIDTLILKLAGLIKP